MDRRSIVIAILLFIIGFMLVNGSGTEDKIQTEKYILEKEPAELIKTITNDHTIKNVNNNYDNKEYYYYKYISYLDAYQKITCYKSPPEGKLLYTKCP